MSLYQTRRPAVRPAPPRLSLGRRVAWRISELLVQAGLVCVAAGLYPPAFAEDGEVPLLVLTALLIMLSRAVYVVLRDKDATLHGDPPPLSDPDGAH